MEKTDLKKHYAELYKMPAGKIKITEVPLLQYIMADGHGDPNNSPLFQTVVEALYGTAYTMKFMLKKGPLQADYTVMPLEGLWWTDDMRFSMEDRTPWKWTLMILQPEAVTQELFNEATATLIKKKKGIQLPPDLRLETMHEGLCAQTLHTGPYSDEPPVIAHMHEWIKQQGYNLRGKHREIYLSDMRRTAPEKLKTILRQPISPAS